MERRRFIELSAIALTDLGISACGVKALEPTPTNPSNVVKSVTEVPTNNMIEQNPDHDNYHYPVVDGQRVDPVPYLTLPFKRSEVTGNLYDVTEGWYYSDEEYDIHGFRNHFGTDLAVPYGTPLYAPCDGYVMSSYHSLLVRNEDGSLKLYQGKPISNGLGYFIQIYVGNINGVRINRFVQLGHLSDISPDIPFSIPTRDGDNWNPTNYRSPIKELTKSPMVVSVRKGDPLGKVGTSGLSWGYQEYKEGAKRPVPIDPLSNKTWDETHVHFEECFRDQTTGDKGWQRDPYAIYKHFDQYPDPSRIKPMGKDPLWLNPINGLPQFVL